MKDVELVIKIPERIYNTIMSTQSYIFGFSSEKSLSAETLKAIRTGTPLQKGHGRLIDADEIQFDNIEFDTYGDYCMVFNEIDQADTIIEADKEESEVQNEK